MTDTDAENFLQCECGSIQWAVLMRGASTDDVRLAAGRCEECEREIPLSDQIH